MLKLAREQTTSHEPEGAQRLSCFGTVLWYPPIVRRVRRQHIAPDCAAICRKAECDTRGNARPGPETNWGRHILFLHLLLESQSTCSARRSLYAVAWGAVGQKPPVTLTSSATQPKPPRCRITHAAMSSTMRASSTQGAGHLCQTWRIMRVQPIANIWERKSGSA